MAKAATSTKGGSTATKTKAKPAAQSAPAADEPSTSKSSKGGKKKQQYVKFRSPIGIAVFPKLHRAYSWDEASERPVPDPDGQYSTRLSVPSEDAQDFVKTIKTTITDSGVKPKHIPFEDETDEDGNKTGNTSLKLKAYGKKKDDTPNKIKFFDADGNPLRGVIDVTPGSRIRLSGWISVSKQGCRLNVNQCQIIELAEREGEGFDAVEGGSFRASDMEDDNTDEEETTTSDEAEETSEDDEGEEF